MSEEMNSLPNDEQQPSSNPCQLISTVMHGSGEELLGAYLYNDNTVSICKSAAPDDYTTFALIPFSFIEAVYKQMQDIQEGKVCAAR